MGEVKKNYCDLCKAVFTPATFSTAGGERGVVNMRLAVWKETGEPLEAVEADLCESCYNKVLAWARGRKETAAADFNVSDPSTKKLTFPGV